MSAAQPAGPPEKIVALQERRLDRTVLHTYRLTVDVDDLLPNERQPRPGPKEDPELQRQIEANEGIYEPLLVEPHPQLPAKFRIIDGDRRWINSVALARQHKGEYRRIPVEVTDRTLSEDERLRVWIFLNRHRKEWNAEKEMVADRLVELVGPTGAAVMLGVTTRELRRWIEVFELSRRFANLRDQTAALTWARELHGISKKLLTPSVIEAVVEKVSQNRITDSKDLRKLRSILKDPVARAHFLSDEGDIESATQRLAGEQEADSGLIGDLDALLRSIRSAPWTALEGLKNDPAAIRRIDDAQALLASLRDYLSGSTRRSAGGSTSTGYRPGRGR